VGNGYLYAGPEFAFFQGSVGEELGETLRMVQVLRPLFHALKLSDIEGALEAMAGFKGEETRSHGPYVLAWSGNLEEPAFLWKRGVSSATTSWTGPFSPAGRSSYGTPG
jgi:hypothetical protein